MVLWNIYDDDKAFFPAESTDAISRFDIHVDSSGAGTGTGGNNGAEDGEGSSGVSL